MGSCSINRKGYDMTSKIIQPVSLAQETRAALPTSEAAYHLNRAQQTLRLWAMREDGPLRPRRINGRLAWSVSELRELLGVAQ
jgi:hypothetical protein